jgi:hypothetical protein
MTARQFNPHTKEIAGDAQDNVLRQQNLYSTLLITLPID